MPRRGYSHYCNLAQGGCIFATTTCLDFVHAFARSDLADLMAASLLEDCRYYQAILSGFVVMPHHIHLLAVLPEGKSASWFMNRLKSNSARRIVPWLGAEFRDRFAEQRGLNGRAFWQRSFRSVGIDSEREWAVKLDYIHQNPVRAGLVERPEDYRWSSMRFRLAGRCSDSRGLFTEDGMIEEFAIRSLLELRQTRVETLSAPLAHPSTRSPS